MKIAILSRYQNTSTRGVESVVSELVAHLSKDFEVEVLSEKNSDSIQRMIKGGYDIIMPTNGRLQSLKASVGRLFARYKLVIGGHSGVGKDDIFNILVRPNLFIALTDDMKDWVKRWAWGVKVIKINNGVDLKKFSPNGLRISLDLPRPIILSVGALTWYKYHERAIKAVAQVDKGSLLIVGKGEEKEKLEKLGKDLLGKRFAIMSFDYSEMPSVYRSVDLFTLPSWDREAFGVVYLEAMASNIPVVAPNDKSRKEIVGQGGILVDVTDAGGYAKAIKEALLRDWGDLPRKQSENFAWDKIVKLYEAAFRRLV